MRRSQALVILLLATTFTAGVAAGVAADRLWLRPEGAVSESADVERPHREEDEKKGKEEDTVIERFSEELGLTPSQKARIDTILHHYRESMRELRREVRPRYDALVDSARLRIEAVLDSSQARKYRKLLERKEERHEEKGDENDGEKDDGHRDGEVRDGGVGNR